MRTRYVSAFGADLLLVVKRRPADIEGDMSVVMAEEQYWYKSPFADSGVAVYYELADCLSAACLIVCEHV